MVSSLAPKASKQDQAGRRARRKTRRSGLGAGLAGSRWRQKKERKKDKHYEHEAQSHPTSLPDIPPPPLLQKSHAFIFICYANGQKQQWTRQQMLGSISRW